MVCLGGLLLQFAARSSAADLNPQRWEKEIAAFEAADRTNPPPKGAVLFIGSSSIRYWTNLAEAFPNMKVINRGFGGSHLPDSTHFADRIIFPYEPSRIVLYGGDNDLSKGRTPEQIMSDFKEFVATVHKKLPDTKIYYLAVKPSPSRWYLSPQAKQTNKLIRRYSRFNRKVEFIDVWTPLLQRNGRPDPTLYERDRLHINQRGYELWTPVIREALEG